MCFHKVIATAFRIAILSLVLAAVPKQAVYAEGFTVNSTNDADDGTCDGSHCSLREAIDAANGSGTVDTIDFDGATFGGGCEHHPDRSFRRRP